MEIPNYQNRFLWFHPDGIIVNVRISAEEDATLIKEELIMCRDDLKLFYLMNNFMFRYAGNLHNISTSSFKRLTKKLLEQSVRIALTTW